MSFEPKDYGVTIKISKEDLLKTYYNGPSPALKELLDATSIKYTAEWFKSEYEWALEKELMSYHEPELKAFEEIKVILAGNPDRLNDGEFIYSIVKSVFMKTYSDIIPDEKMLKAAFDAVQIHIIPELNKEQMNYNKYKDLLTPPSNTPLGTTGTNKAGGDLTFSSPGWATASTFTPFDVVTTSTTPWTGGTTPVAPSPKPKAPEKPFSIDDMYAGPKPSWAKKDKAQAKGHKHQSGQQTALDKAFEELAAAKTQVLQDIAKLEAEGKPISQTLQVHPVPKPSTISKVQAKMDEAILSLFGYSKEKK